MGCERGSKHDTTNFGEENFREVKLFFQKKKKKPEQKNMKSYFAYVKFDSLLEIQVELLNKYLDMEVNMKIHIIESSAHR